MPSEKLAEAGTPFTPDRTLPHADRPSAADKSALAAELRAKRDWRLTGLAAAAEAGAVDLGGEDLRGVDFTGAPLEGASFRDAHLAGARFAWARLAHADFTGATGLIGAQFARAELGGARLPATVRFVAFDTASEIAEGAPKLFLTVMLVCAYSWLTIASTLDAKLLTDTAVSKLPIVNAEIPIVNFFTLVPIVLVGMALLLMLQAQPWRPGTSMRSSTARCCKCCSRGVRTAWPPTTRWSSRSTPTANGSRARTSPIR